MTSKSNRITTGIFIGVVLMIIAVVGWYFYSVNFRLAVASKMADGAEFRLKFPLDKAFVYRLDYEMKGRILTSEMMRVAFGRTLRPEKSDSGGTWQNLNEQEHAIVRLSPVSQQADAVEILAEVFRSKPDRVDELWTKVPDIYGLVTVNTRGQITRMVLPPDVSSDAASRLKAMMQSVAVRFPTIRSASEWSVREDNGDGRWLSRYRIRNVSSDASRMTFAKDSAEYVSASRSRIRAFRTADPVEKRMDVNVTFDFDIRPGVILNLSGSQRVETTVSNRLVADVDTKVAMSLWKIVAGKADVVELIAQNLRRDGIDSPLDSRSEQAELRTKTLRLRLEKRTYNDIVPRLLNKPNASFESIREDYWHLKALLTVHPETATRLGVELATIDPGSLVFGYLAEALASVGNSESQEALGYAIRSVNQNDSALLALMSFLVLVEEPTLATENLIRELANNSASPDVSAAARFNLGIIGRALRDSFPERSTAIFWELANLLRQQSRLHDQELTLAALGNLGAPEQVSVAETFVGSRSEELRRASAWSLRFVDSEEAERQLLAILAADSSAQVRATAAAALGFHVATPEILAGYAASIANERDPDVKQTVHKNLSDAEPRR